MGNTGSTSNPLGFQVLGVFANSPLKDAGLVPFFDFIIQLNNIPIATFGENIFYNTVIDRSQENSKLKLTILNCKSGIEREIDVVSSKFAFFSYHQTLKFSYFATGS